MLMRWSCLIFQPSEPGSSVPACTIVIRSTGWDRGEMAWMADQTRNTPSPAINTAAPANRASTARAGRHPRAGPSATDARRRRSSLPKGSRQSSENSMADRASLSRRSVRWSAMRANPAMARRGGPFLIPTRTLLLASGLIAVGLGTFTLLHERHSGQVDAVYLIVGLIVAVVWLASLVLAFRGFRIGIFLAPAFAFIDFGVTAPSHFEAGPASLGSFVKSEGLPVATVAMGLLCACVLTVVTAAVAWGNARGRDRRLNTLPLLLVAVAGAVLVILQATDGVHRDSFGTANTEDGAFAAAVTASLWLLGGLWIAR